MNKNPILSVKTENRTEIKIINNKLEVINKDTIYEILRDIRDPEHPHTLEELGVIKKEYIEIGEKQSTLINDIKVKYIIIQFHPTIPHCSMAAIIGLSIQLQMRNYIPVEYLVKVLIVPESHINWEALNKQLNDKDRVMAAFENEALYDVINSTLQEYNK
ncbi:Protein AE7 [Astathelohania contejeani]|uniref:Protein AE7 n=1 Tax=Astathelohania contejeani TaxID=164912 RepID=A0ABQ7HXX2_9MICR|nr:Protein AE7 [Thelohania contejeani]